MSPYATELSYPHTFSRSVCVLPGLIKSSVIYQIFWRLVIFLANTPCICAGVCPDK